MLFLHLSDIHFRKTEIGDEADPNLALRSDIIQDVKRMREKIGKAADGVLLGGDVAFAGLASEYQFAYDWLEKKLCPAAGCATGDVFVVPGNHDVDRNAGNDPAQKLSRVGLRGFASKHVNDEIRKWLHSKISSDVIFGPIEEYNRFASRFRCLLKPYKDSTEPKDTKDSDLSSDDDLPRRPFARRDVKLNDGSILRLWGFNTVLVSDITDAKDRMLIDPSAAQIEEEDGVCHLVMAHHPFEWLKNGADFKVRCEKVAAIQLFGHEHTLRVDEGKHFLRIRAGAMHPERDAPEWKPGYNWIDISVNGAGKHRKLCVKVWVRQFETNNFIEIPDLKGKPIWENYYDLPEWSEPPVQVDETAKPAEPVIKGETVTAPPSPPPTIKSVTIKLFKLQEHEQRRIITLLKLDKPADRELKDYELAVAAVIRSSDSGTLDQMDVLINKTLAGEFL